MRMHMAHITALQERAAAAAATGTGAKAGLARPSTAPSPKLVRAAHEFEGQMMQELLKPITEEFNGGEDESGSAGALGDFASEALGQAISQSGGFGIADKIIKELSRAGGQQISGSGALPGEERSGPGIAADSLRQSTKNRLRSLGKTQPISLDRNSRSQVTAHFPIPGAAPMPER